MPDDFLSRHVELVVKISKLCNLRCSYCYEFKDLADPSRIPLASIEKLLGNLSSFQPAAGPPSDSDTFTFIWHGGEPLMIKPAYYDEIGKLQASLLPEKLTYHNSVQTNLTILTDAQTEHLREGSFFQTLGFSFDVYGEQRLDTRGRSSTDKVLRNLQKLRDNDIPAGAIVVLSQSTLPHIGEIYKFYEAVGTDFRILPYNIETFEQQTETNGLAPDEIVAALCRVFDLWLQSEQPVAVEPLETYLGSAIAYQTGRRNTYFDKLRDESIFVIDMDGATYGYESYLAEHQYGNLFDQTFEEMLDSPARRRLAEKASARVERYCTSCKFYGACSGFAVAEALPMEQEWLRTRGCYVADVISHIVARLETTGLVASVAASRPGRRVVAAQDLGKGVAVQSAPALARHGEGGEPETGDLSAPPGSISAGGSGHGVTLA